MNLVGISTGQSMKRQDENQTHEPGTTSTNCNALETESKPDPETLCYMFIQEQVLRHMQRI
jgi:hypothetical protein